MPDDRRPSLARLLTTTADELARHGATTAVTVEAWSTLTLGAAGPGQVNAVSDPVGSLVAMFADHNHDPRPLNDPCAICTAMLARRWVTAGATIRRPSRRLFGAAALGLPIEALCRLLSHRTSDLTGTERHDVGRACGDLRAIILEARPLTVDEAQHILDDEARLANGASRCKACDSPEPRLLGGFGVDCYKIRSKQMQRGQYVDDDTFIAHVRAGVSRGEINRPSSPLWMTTAPRVTHEGDDA